MRASRTLIAAVPLVILGACGGSAGDGSTPGESATTTVAQSSADPNIATAKVDRLDALEATLAAPTGRWQASAVANSVIPDIYQWSAFDIPAASGLVATQYFGSLTDDFDFRYDPENVYLTTFNESVSFIEWQWVSDLSGQPVAADVFEWRAVTHEEFEQLRENTGANMTLLEGNFPWRTLIELVLADESLIGDPVPVGGGVVVAGRRGYRTTIDTKLAADYLASLFDFSFYNSAEDPSGYGTPAMQWWIDSEGRVGKLILEADELYQAALVAWEDASNVSGPEVEVLRSVTIDHTIEIFDLGQPVEIDLPPGS